MSAYRYIEALAKPDTIIFTAPYTDASGGTVLITAAKTIRMNGVIVGVMGTDVAMSALDTAIGQTKILNQGYAYFIDTPIHSYTLLYTPIHSYTLIYTHIHSYTPYYAHISPYTHKFHY